MAFSNIDPGLNLGHFLQIVFSDGVRNQISEDFRDWEMIRSAKVSDTGAREIRFLFQKALGPAAIQYRNPGSSGREFPSAQQISTNENTAKLKEIDGTIELEYNLYKRALKSPEKYAEPLAREIQSKAISCKRRLAADLYADGTGVIGQLPASSVAVQSPASDKIVVTLESSDSARGHIGFFEFDDILLLRAEDGSASALDTNLATEPAFFKVVSKDRLNNQVVLQGLDSSLASAGTISSVSVQPTAGDVFYRYGQPTIPDLTSIGDYGTATEVIPGLESLTANDGRLIHGITMEGSCAGSRYDAGNDPLDVRHIHAAMDQGKIAVGQGAYSWKMMCMAPEAAAHLIESRETDRRFHSVMDETRGVKKFVYQHFTDPLEVYTSEYCPKKRIYIKPEARSGQKVLEYWGTDFESVKLPGMGPDGFMLKPHTSGGYQNTVVSYMNAYGTLICKHPAAINVVKNFSLD